jgi:acyl carrier protein
MIAVEIDRITSIICRVGKVTALRPTQDIYEAGLTSLHALDLLLELESECAVSIPDARFMAARTPQALQAMIGQLKQGAN